MPDWVTTALIGLGSLVLGHISGVMRERRKQALINRLELLKPVEEWIGTANKVVSIVADGVVALVEGLPLPVGYSIEARLEVGRQINESTPRAQAVLSSKALRTLGTWRLSSTLSRAVDELNTHLQTDLLRLDMAVLDKGATWSSPGKLLERVTDSLAKAKELVREAYEAAAKLKVKLV